MLRSGISLLVLMGLFCVSGCAQRPCEELMDRQCAAAGETLCGAMKAKVSEAGETKERDRRCAAVLADETLLRANLDALRAAAALEAVNATPAPAGAPEVESVKAAVPVEAGRAPAPSNSAEERPSAAGEAGAP